MVFSSSSLACMVTPNFDDPERWSFAKKDLCTQPRTPTWCGFYTTCGLHGTYSIESLPRHNSAGAVCRVLMGMSPLVRERQTTLANDDRALSGTQENSTLL